MNYPKTILSIIGLYLLSGLLSAATISGFVTRADSDEPVHYANLRIAELKTGTQSNKQGYYVISINQPGTYTLVVTLISYSTQQLKFTVNSLGETLSHNFALEKSSIELGTVKVTASGDWSNSINIPVSTVRRTTEQLQNVVSVAESDVFRALCARWQPRPESDPAGRY